MNASERFAKRLHESQSGFLYRVSGVEDPIRICEAMRDLLREIRIAFGFMFAGKDALDLLQEAAQLTEKAFTGEEAPGLWQKYSELGTILMGAGNDRLGVACHYLHFTFGNRRPSQWPTTRAVNSEQSNVLKSLLPILHEGFDDIEVTTSKHLKRIS